MKLKQTIAMMIAMGMMSVTIPGLAGEAPDGEVPAGEAAVEAVPAGTAAGADTMKLEASYTLALNAISAGDYETAKTYLNVCFVYCDPAGNPAMYADLLLKRACIDVIEERNDMALLQLDAALRLQPDLADAYLVRTQVYASQGEVDAAIGSLERYIELTEDTSLYETVARLNEAKGDIEAARTAYDKYVEGAGAEIEEAGFQAGLYRMQAGQPEAAVEAFEPYLENEAYVAGAAYNIAICKMNMGDYAGAIEAFDVCEQKGGRYEGLYYNRGVCGLMSGLWETAAADFTKSIESEPYEDDARYNLAICQMQQEDYETAAANFTRLIDGEAEKQTEVENDTVNDGMFYYRAVCNFALGNLEAALADYTVCIEHGYELAQSYYQRAQVYAALGNTDARNADLQASLSAAE